MGIPVKYRRGGESVLGTYDFFSTLGGTGYISIYLCGGMHQTDVKEYFLTLDNSISSDEDNYTLVGNQNVNFDLEVGKPFRVKEGTAIMGSANYNSAGESCQVTWTVYHVDADGNATSIGTAEGDAWTYASNSKACRKTVKISISEKSFKKGEKLRINVNQTAGSGSGIRFDPAGRTVSGTIGSVSGDTFLRLPVDLPS